MVIERSRRLDIGAPNFRVEIVDQAIPGRDGIYQAAPEVLAFPAIKIFDGNALLLDPRIVAKIENALSLNISQIEHVVVAYAAEIAAEQLAGVRLVKAI